MARFNIQTFLSEMKEELQKNTDRIEIKLDDALQQLHAHDKRIVTLESSRKNTRWFVGVLVIAVITAAFDLLLTHLP